MDSRKRILLVFLLAAAGILVMVYPSLSDHINRLHSSRAVQHFSDTLADTGSAELDRQRRLAEGYNAALSGGIGQGDTPEQYEQIMDFGNGIMGVLTIPKIGAELSIYHGVSETVLSKGVGHLPGSALPIGGKGNHSILTGHTGLPSAELFTGLTELEPGDPFRIQVLGETLHYAVDQITMVLPHEVDSLGPVPGRDYCTLVTCTPYGINSHRLLVRGERVEAPPLPAAGAHRPAEAQTGVPVPPELILAGGSLLLLLAAGGVILLRRKKDGHP